MKFLLIFLSVICLTGCTVDISKDKDVENNVLNVEEETDEFVEVDLKIKSLGVTSSISNPLSIGEYGIASKYNASLEEYKDVDVTIKKIYDNSDEVISNYNLENPENVISKENGYKYVVLDYEVIFYDFETESFGTDVILDVEVSDISNNSFVINGVKQVVHINVLSSDKGVVDGDKGIVQIAFAIPNSVNSYLVKFGTYDHTIAYYKV